MTQFLALASAGLYALLGAGAPESSPPPAATAPPSSASPSEAKTAGPLKSPGNAKWAATPDEARTRAGAEDKYVFLEFDRPECGPCQRMDALLYPAFDFEALLLQMVPAKVSLESPEGRELSRRYAIKDTPAILVTTSEGRLIFFVQGFTNTREFYAHIHQDLGAYRTFARRLETQSIAKIPAKEALDTGRELYQRSDPEAALPRLRRAVSAPGGSAVIRDEAREILAAVELDLGQKVGARQTIDRLIATTKDPRRLERAELFRAQLPLADNHPAEALALFQKFERDHPQSPYIERVRAMLLRLTGAGTP
ncbi:MAG: hypothetical protein ABI592_15410 [Acidobacteriota bacterium]